MSLVSDKIDVVPKNGYLLCNQNRTLELSNRIYERNIPSSTLQSYYSPRAVPTKMTVFPALDCHSPVNVPIMCQKQYNQDTIFNPGTSAPFDGFQRSVDNESRLRNIIFPIQDAIQSHYVPSSNSSLYKTNINPKTPAPQGTETLFQEPRFEPFNPNPCDLGYKLFYNHTRQQVKDL